MSNWRKPALQLKIIFGAPDPSSERCTGCTAGAGHGVPWLEAEFRPWWTWSATSFLQFSSEEMRAPSSTAPVQRWPGWRLSPEQGSQERDIPFAACH